jgi:hypothetical protein
VSNMKGFIPMKTRVFLDLFSKLICLFRFFRLFIYGFKNEQKILVFGFVKQTENQPKQNPNLVGDKRTDYSHILHEELI